MNHEQPPRDPFFEMMAENFSTEDERMGIFDASHALGKLAAGLRYDAVTDRAGEFYREADMTADFVVARDALTAKIRNHRSPFGGPSRHTMNQYAVEVTRENGLVGVLGRVFSVEGSFANIPVFRRKRGEEQRVEYAALHDHFIGTMKAFMTYPMPDEMRMKTRGEIGGYDLGVGVIFAKGTILHADGLIERPADPKALSVIPITDGAKFLWHAYEVSER